VGMSWILCPALRQDNRTNTGESGGLNQGIFGSPRKRLSESRGSSLNARMYS